MHMEKGRMRKESYPKPISPAWPRKDTTESWQYLGNEWCCLLASASPLASWKKLLCLFFVFCFFCCCKAWHSSWMLNVECWMLERWKEKKTKKICWRICLRPLSCQVLCFPSFMEWRETFLLLYIYIYVDVCSGRLVVHCDFVASDPFETLVYFLHCRIRGEILVKCPVLTRAFLNNTTNRTKHQT